MNELINRAIAMRKACLWLGRGKRSNDNFEGSIGRLRSFTSSYPVYSKEAVAKFRQGILYRDFVTVVPGNVQGRAVIDAMEQRIDVYP